MGNSRQGISVNQFLPNASHWLIIPKTRRTYSKYQINYLSVRNRLNGKILDRYVVSFLNQEQQKVYKFYCKQRSLSSELVGVACYTPITTTELCMNQIKAYVYFQHFTHQLSQIKNLLFYQGIYALQRALNGFKLLYSSKGYFKLKQNLIFFTKAGEIKIWLNEDLSKMQPQMHNQKPKDNPEHYMIFNIISIIQNKTMDQVGHIKFSSFVRRRNFQLKNFEHAISIFNYYVNQYKISIPNCCKYLFQRLISNSPDHRLASGSVKKKLSRPKGQILFSKQKTGTVTKKQQRLNLQKNIQKRVQKSFLNYSIDQSQALSIIWQKNTQKQISFTIQGQNQKQQMTIANLLINQTTVNKSLTPLLQRFSYIQAESIQACKSSLNTYLQINPKQKFTTKPDSTSPQTPKDQSLNTISLQKCKFYELDKSIAIDSLIAQDLLQQLQ